jgi:hypothetical protein
MITLKKIVCEMDEFLMKKKLNSNGVRKARDFFETNSIP